jgi:hypothetical protein
MSTTHLVGVPSNLHRLTVRSATAPRVGTCTAAAVAFSADVDSARVSAPIAVDAPASMDSETAAATMRFFMFLLPVVGSPPALLTPSSRDTYTDSQDFSLTG